MEYRIVTHYGLDGLESLVNHMLGQGWQLCGGMAVVHQKSNKRRYAQAMVRETPWEPMFEVGKVDDLESYKAEP